MMLMTINLAVKDPWDVGDATLQVVPMPAAAERILSAC